jgi:hypothetical protein
MSDALIISAALLFLIAVWGVIVFLLGWKHSPDQPAGSRWRRFWIVVFALCGLALLATAAIRTSIPRNPAINEATQLAEQSPSVTALLGTPIRLTGLAYGGYRGYGEGRRVSAGLRLKGPKSFATLHICGIKRHGQWELLYAEVAALNTLTIPLTGSSNPCRLWPAADLQ